MQRRRAAVLAATRSNRRACPCCCTRRRHGRQALAFRPARVCGRYRTGAPGCSRHSQRNTVPLVEREQHVRDRARCAAAPAAWIGQRALRRMRPGGRAQPALWSSAAPSCAPSERMHAAMPHPSTVDDLLLATLSSTRSTAPANPLCCGRSSLLSPPCTATVVSNFAGTAIDSFQQIMLQSYAIELSCNELTTNTTCEANPACNYRPQDVSVSLRAISPVSSQRVAPPAWKQ
jgi:hypothetical protein